REDGRDPRARRRADAPAGGSACVGEAASPGRSARGRGARAGRPRAVPVSGDARHRRLGSPGLTLPAGRALLRRLVRANERCSYALTKIWPRDRGRANRLYLELVVAAIRERSGQVVVDVGGGSSLRYAPLIERDEAHVVAVDESAEALARNIDV